MKKKKKKRRGKIKIKRPSQRLLSYGDRGQARRQVHPILEKRNPPEK